MLVALVIGLNCYGQESLKKNTLSIGTNVSFYFSEPIAGLDLLSFADIYGPSIYGEYTFSLNNNISVSPRISSGYAFKIKPLEEMAQLSSFALSTTINVRPFPKTFKRLKLSLGGLYHKINQVSLRSLSEDYLSYAPAYSGNSISYNSTKWGLLGSVQVDIIDNEQYSLGVRYDLFSAFTERNLFEFNSWQIGTYIGVKF